MTTTDPNTRPQGGTGGGEGGIPDQRRPQVDPGLQDWRHYQLQWGDETVFVELIATRTADGDFAAGTEYWYVDKAELTEQSSIKVVSLGDRDWGDTLPTTPSQCQQFTAATDATWTQVGTDISAGSIFKHTSNDWYLRIAITGTAPNATISVVRWYQGTSSQPGATFNPSGVYDRLTSLGSGTTWFADSKSPS